MENKEVITDIQTIVEMAILPEVPTVQYGQQVYIHVPIASYNIPGIASFCDRHFSIVGNKIFLSDDILNQANIIHVSVLPVDNIDKNSIYVVDDKLYIYLESKQSWIRLLSDIDRQELEKAISDIDISARIESISKEDIDALFGG